MDPTIIVRRRADANKRITNAVNALADRLQVDPPDLASIPRVGGPEAMSVYWSERMATYLESLIEALPKRQRSRSTAEKNGDSAEGQQAQDEGGSSTEGKPALATEDAAGASTTDADVIQPAGGNPKRDQLPPPDISGE
jgi:hypothetical protein